MQTLGKEQIEKVLTEGSAIRVTAKLFPAGGKGEKVFPPTYADGQYAMEKRIMSDGKIQETVLLDSVQSQANRMEFALLESIKSGKVKMSLLKVDFNEINGLKPISTLETPHRIADAIFRESLLGDTPFRVSEIGKAFVKSTPQDATGLFQYCPHALVFGVWDSAGTGIGNKFQRIITSEIVGIDVHCGVKTASRIDPVIKGGSKTELYAKANGEWTVDPSEAAMEKGKPKKYGKKVSEINLGNVLPSINKLGGGVTLDHAIHTTVISIPAIRKLHFPVNGKEDYETDKSGRAVILSLALSSFKHSIDYGYDLRSRCLLIPEDDPRFEYIDGKGNASEFTLTTEAADRILNEAITEAINTGLPWMEQDITLKANENFKKLILENMKKVEVEDETDNTVKDTEVSE
jgi:CRISPR-associated protein Csb1